MHMAAEGDVDAIGVEQVLQSRPLVCSSLQAAWNEGCSAWMCCCEAAADCVGPSFWECWGLYLGDQGYFCSCLNSILRTLYTLLAASSMRQGHCRQQGKRRSITACPGQAARWLQSDHKRALVQCTQSG